MTAALLLIALALCASVFALDPTLDVRQYAHTAWRARDGFVKGTVRAIAQTPDGYLWIGASWGLLRFDGVHAVQWQPPAGEQLPSNEIEGLLVARDGTLWISTLGGLASWREGKFTQYPEVAGRVLGTFLQDTEGTIWFGISAPGGLCSIRSGKAECEGAQLFGRFVDAVFENRKKELWVSAETGIWRWKPGPPRQFAFPGGVNQAPSISETAEGTLLLSTNDGIKQLLDGKIQSYALPGITGPVNADHFLRSSDGSLWIGTRTGLLHLHRGRTDAFRAADGLSGDDVGGRIFEDREGSIWVGTASGLDRFRAYAVPRMETSEGLSASAPWAVQAMPDGGVWLATANGLDLWRNGHVVAYSARGAQGRSEVERSSGGLTTWIADSGFTGAPGTFGLDNQGRLWASSTEGVFTFEGGRFVRIPGVAGGPVFSIVEDPRGTMWISNLEQGLLSVEPDKTVQRIPWTRFGNKPYGARTLAADPMRGGVWLGFYDGGISYLKGGQVHASYTVSDGLGGGRINHLRFSQDGALWAATEGGLSRIKDGRIATLTSKNGLPCDEVHWSMEDDGHDLWVYMPCGLSRIDRSEWQTWIQDPGHVIKTTIFDISDGVSSVGVFGSFGPHVTRTADGKIWFVPFDGVSILDPRHLPVNNVPPPVQIERIVADGKEFDTGERVPLPAHVRDLSIDYTALSLVDPDKVHFKVKLEGQDNDWRELVNVRQVEYTNLPPHSYRFRVLACNNSGVWNEVGASLDFSIAPAYYQTTWFRLLCVAAFAALLCALYQLRLHEIQRQLVVGMEARVGERLRIARELHDTLLQSFQGVAFQLQAARKLLQRKAENAEEVLDEAILATEEAIREGRSAIRDLRPEPAAQRNLPELLNAVGRELAAAQEPDRHAPGYQVVVEGKQQDLSPMLQDEVYRISREAIRNGFAHAVASHIEVEIRYGQDELRLRIRDDGKGIGTKILEAGGQSGHFGIAGMRERAQRIGAQLEFWSEEGAGTEVELTVPASLAYQRRRDGRQFRLFHRAGKDAHRS